MQSILVSTKTAPATLTRNAGCASSIHDASSPVSTFVSCGARLLLLIACVAIAIPVGAQPCPALQVRNPHGNYIVPGSLGDIPYGEHASLDAYVQQGPARPASIVLIHGGGWSSGSRVAHVSQILELVTGAGYNWFAVDYRLGGLSRLDDSLADLRAALSFIRCRASEFGIDPDHLVLLGEDSGAHLAALLAGERPPGVVGTVLIGALYEPDANADRARAINPALLGRVSLLARVPPEMAPLLVVHGGADTEAAPEQAHRYCARVVASGGRCRFVEVAGASHRSENWYPSQWGYKQDIVRWLSALGSAQHAVYRRRTGAVVKDILYSPSAHLRLDAVLPKSAQPVPAVIVVHGGGWEAGDKVTYVTPLFEPLADAGLAWFSIDYRLTPRFTNEDQLEDVRQAVRFLKAQHTRFNIDPRRVFLVGESASGQMVAQLAAEDRSLAGVVSFYGVYDIAAMVTDASPRSLLVRLFRRGVLDDESRAILRKYSPLYQAHADMPPILLVNGTGERLWAQAQTFAERLQQVGVEHDVIALDGAPHGMENWEGHPEWMFYKRRVVEWIQRIAAAPRPVAVRQ
ncbi:MAG: acetyl esterase [Acidobacteriota bacterium]|jgi:alpha-L-fucosidase 2